MFLNSGILCKKSRSHEVIQLQNSLIEKGYNAGKFGADGVFGAATEEAVKAFQRNYDFTVDGKVI